MDRKRFRKRMVPAAVIAVLAAVPAAAYADEPKDNVFVAEPGNPYDEATWNRIHDNVLEYDEIGILVNEFSPTYKNLRETYEDNKNASKDVEKVKEQLMAGSGALIDQANSLSDTASSIRDMLGYQNMVTPDAYASMVYSAELLNYQSEQMLLMGDSVTEVTPEMLHVQVVETGRASLISGAQTAMIGYEQLLLSKEQLESSLELLEAVYQSTVTQANVGMATQADVLSAKQNLESAQAGMLTIEANEQNIRQTLCTMLGWAYNASPEIRPVPAADESRIAVMNPETDKEKAIANNFTLKYNVLSLDTLTDGSAEKANMERTVAQQKEQIASKLTNLYNDVLQKQSELATAKAAYELEQTKMNAASQKLQLGTIGRLEYLQQENSLKNQEIAVKNAELALFQSMETYGWTLEGNLSLT